MRVSTSNAERAPWPILIIFAMHSSFDFSIEVKKMAIVACIVTQAHLCDYAPKRIVNVFKTNCLENWFLFNQFLQFYLVDWTKNDKFIDAGIEMLFDTMQSDYCR